MSTEPGAIQGLRGDAYQRFKETECDARAKRAYLEPLRAHLKLIDELIAQLRQPTG